jgi:hypothetical protein
MQIFVYTNSEKYLDLEVWTGGRGETIRTATMRIRTAYITALQIWTSK